MRSSPAPVPERVTPKAGAVRSISWLRCWNGQVFAMLTEHLNDNVRAALAGTGTVREGKMFGGIGFMLNGNLVAAASKRGRLVRVGKERQGDPLVRVAPRPIFIHVLPSEGSSY